MPEQTQVPPPSPKTPRSPFDLDRSWLGLWGESTGGRYPGSWRRWRLFYRLAWIRRERVRRRRMAAGEFDYGNTATSGRPPRQANPSPRETGPRPPGWPPKKSPPPTDLKRSWLGLWRESRVSRYPGVRWTLARRLLWIVETRESRQKLATGEFKLRYTVAKSRDDT